MHRFILGTLLATLGSLALFGPAEASAGGEEGQVLTWRGCGVSKKAFMAHAAEVYERETGVKLKLSSGGATLGIHAAGEGAADFGGTCRHCLVEGEEVEMPLVLTLVAWDALAVVTHPSNPVKDISVAQLRDVLAGKITNWSELGGKDLAILVVGREGKISGVGHMLRELILGDVDFEFGPRFVRFAGSSPVEQLVEKSPSAIAVSGVSSARLRKLQLLKLDGAEPSAEAIAKGIYPYYRPLYLAHAPKLSGAAQAFRDWLIAEGGQKAVAEMGTVTLEQGLELVGTFKAFGDKTRIANLPALQARLEAKRKREAR